MKIAPTSTVCLATILAKLALLTHSAVLAVVLTTALSADQLLFAFATLAIMTMESAKLACLALQFA